MLFRLCFYDTFYRFLFILYIWTKTIRSVVTFCCERLEKWCLVIIFSNACHFCKISLLRRLMTSAKMMKSSKPDFKDERNVYEEQLLELKKWRDEKYKDFTRIQDEQRAVITSQRLRIETLCKDQIESVILPFTRRPANCSSQSEKPLPKSQPPELPEPSLPKPPPAAVAPLPPPTTSVAQIPPPTITVAPLPTPESVLLKDSEKHEQLCVTSNMEKAPLCVNTNNKPVRGTLASFEEAIQEQMSKLELTVSKPAAAKPTNVKPRPFLKKGEGLLKYKMKSKPKKTTQPSSNHHMLPIASLKLKPPVADGKREKAPHVQFNVPTEDDGLLSVNSEPIPIVDSYEVEACASSRPDISFKARKEPGLSEFEILEKAAQHSSFCSDSSFVHRMLQKDKAKIIFNEANEDVAEIEESDLVMDMGEGKLSEFISELQAKRAQLGRELASTFPPDEATNTNIALGNLIVPSKEITGPLSSRRDHAGVCGNVNLGQLGRFTRTLGSPDHLCVDINKPLDELSSQQPFSDSNTSESIGAKPHIRLHSKFKELEEEISIYKQNNLELSMLNKQKEEEIGVLKKEREAFNQLKEEELQNIEKEISGKRLQLKREKEAFQNHQRVKRDLPSRKEREDITTLKQQMASLQEELKKQSAKSIADCKRIRKLLEAAESERESLRTENEKLESQQLKLIDTLQAKDKIIKNLRTLAAETKTKQIEAPLSNSSSCTSMDTNSSTEEAALVVAPKRPQTSVKHQVQFNLNPSIYNYMESETTSPKFHEIKHPNKIEKVYADGSKDIIYSSGTKEFVNPDGQYKKYIYYNGDTKEIFPDKRSVYTFIDGTSETNLIDGRQIIEYPNGQKETFYSDGRSETRLLDGTVVVLYADGSHVIQRSDGASMKYLSDGTEVTKYPSGDTEWASADYLKRFYADGSIRTVFTSGRTETFYPSGRVKLKSNEGEVIVDRREIL